MLIGNAVTQAFLAAERRQGFLLKQRPRAVSVQLRIRPGGCPDARGSAEGREQLRLSNRHAQHLRQPGQAVAFGCGQRIARAGDRAHLLQQLLPLLASQAIFYVDPLFSGTTLILSVGLAGWVGRRTARRTSAAGALVFKAAAGSRAQS
jgi:hypothetical protein